MMLEDSVLTHEHVAFLCNDIFPPSRHHNPKASTEFLVFKEG